MDFFPGGAEDDDFDDDGFILDDDDIAEEKIDWSKFKSNEQNDTTSKVNGTSGSGGFGRPPPKKGSSRQPPPRMGEINPRTKDRSSLGMDDFRMAAIKGSLDTLKSFLDNGFKVNTTLKCGWTALLYAANSANVEVVKMLIGYGADVNSNKDMYSVLMAACGSSSNHSEDVAQVVSILLENGADIHAHDRYHMSPLIYAAREGRDTVVSLLLDRGANINKQDSRGWTALSWAVSKNKKKTVTLLLERNANPKMKHCDNQTALDLAVDMEDDKMIALLGGETSDNSTENATTDTTKAVPTKADGDNAYKSASSEVGIRYGEMELFLAGLDLSNYVELFQTQQVDFSTFLRMTDEDLIKMGINQIGVRKKILEGIQGVHKKEWEKSSINSPANKQISCADSVAMVANICKHVKYIGSTIGYIRDQVTANPQILQVQDGTSPKQIYQHSQNALLNVQELQTELHKLNTHLHKVLQTTDFDPPDLIRPKRVKKRRLNVKGLFVLGLCVGTVGVVLWKREDIQGSISKLIIV